MNIYFAKDGNLSKETLLSIRDFVNEAYAKGEEGMWINNTPRTSIEELTERIKADQLVVAEKNRVAVGMLLVYRTQDKDTAEFGMLAVNPQFTKLGIGGQLVDYAENWAISNGMTMMRIELLTPSNWKHPSKEFLKKWYHKLGYAPQREVPFRKDVPSIIAALKTPCDFTEWTKKLIE